MWAMEVAAAEAHLANAEEDLAHTKMQEHEAREVPVGSMHTAHFPRLM